MIRPSDLPPTIAKRIVVLPNGCWLWTGCKDGLYGKARIGNRIWRMHRYTYTVLVAPIAAGHQLDHLCREEICCNPLHVQPVTAVEHRQRSVQRGFPASAHEHWLNKTHCPRGHEYDEANTGRSTRGSRICRACARDNMRARRREPSRLLEAA